MSDHFLCAQRKNWRENVRACAHISMSRQQVWVFRFCGTLNLRIMVSAYGISLVRTYFLCMLWVHTVWLHAERSEEELQQGWHAPSWSVWYHWMVRTKHGLCLTESKVTLCATCQTSAYADDPEKYGIKHESKTAIKVSNSFDQSRGRMFWLLFCHGGTGVQTSRAVWDILIKDRAPSPN